MRVLILTSSLRGTAAAVLPVLAEHLGEHLVGVVHSEGQIPNQQRFLKRKLSKLREIGIGGGINGYRADEVRQVLRRPSPVQEAYRALAS